MESLKARLTDTVDQHNAIWRPWHLREESSCFTVCGGGVLQLPGMTDSGSFLSPFLCHSPLSLFTSSSLLVANFR